MNCRNNLIVINQGDWFLDELEFACSGVTSRIWCGQFLAYGTIEFIEQFLVFRFALLTVSLEIIPLIILG